MDEAPHYRPLYRQVYDSLVKQIADAHGGRAWAANAEDGGAVVAFTLPAV